MDICESPIIRYNFSTFTELGRERPECDRARGFGGQCRRTPPTSPPYCGSRSWNSRPCTHLKALRRLRPIRSRLEAEWKRAQPGSRSARIALPEPHLLFLKAKRDCMFAEWQLCHRCADAESRKR